MIFLCCAERSEFGRRAGRSGAETEERGAAKPRGRGLGQRNIFYFVCSMTMYPLSKPLITVFIERYKSSRSTQAQVPK